MKILNNKIEIKILHHLTQDEIDIRNTVFVEEQGFNEEFDTVDETATHFVMYLNQKPVACARCFPSDNESIYKIGRVAVHREYRGKHFGEQILLSVENYAKNQGAVKISLSSQLRAKEFYAKLGYTTIGDVYLDEHCEHIRMEKEL